MGREPRSGCSHVKITLAFVKCINSVSGNIYLPVVSCQFHDMFVFSTHLIKKSCHSTHEEILKDGEKKH